MSIEKAQAYLDLIVRTSFAERIEIDWPHFRAYAEMPILLPEELGGDGKACLEYGRCNFVEVERSDADAVKAAADAGVAFRVELNRLHSEARKPDAEFMNVARRSSFPQFVAGEIGAIIWRLRPKVRQNDDGTFTASLRFGLMSERFVKHGAIPAE